MKILSLESNNQMLDGGAMFGNAPKTMWSKWIEPDALNRIELASRCLLVIDESGKKILFETGIGDFFSPKLKERYGVENCGHKLLKSLEAAGYSHHDINCVILSHLHFDHAGGILKSFGSDPQDLLFPNAKIIVSNKQWQRANRPHLRDKSSYLPELNKLLSECGRLELVPDTGHQDSFSWLKFYISDGHTPGLLLSEIQSDNGPILFASDLIPGNPWVPLPITMGYDRFPEKLIEEKTEILNTLSSQGGVLFFTHDPQIITSRPCFEENKWKGLPILKAPSPKKLVQNL